MHCPMFQGVLQAEEATEVCDSTALMKPTILDISFQRWYDHQAQKETVQARRV